MLVVAWILLIMYIVPFISSWYVMLGTPKQRLNGFGKFLFIISSFIVAITLGIIFGGLFQ